MPDCPETQKVVQQVFQGYSRKVLLVQIPVKIVVIRDVLLDGFHPACDNLLVIKVVFDALRDVATFHKTAVNRHGWRTLLLTFIFTVAII